MSGNTLYSSTTDTIDWAKLLKERREAQEQEIKATEVKRAIFDQHYTTRHVVQLNAASTVEFEDGTQMSGGDLLKCLKALQRIIERDYPEELL